MRLDELADLRRDAERHLMASKHAAWSVFLTEHDVYVIELPCSSEMLTYDEALDAAIAAEKEAKT